MDKEFIVSTDFSGLGSPEEALKRLQVKHKIAFACDIDKYAKASYLANHEPEIFFDDITTRNQSETPESDLYVFGFPCQAFSISGKRLGFEDTRGTLFYNSLSYIKEKKPRVFIAENVKGLFSHDKAKGSKSKYGRTFGVIRDALGLTINGQHNLYKYDDCVDYHIHFQILNTKHYGLPQNRERIFIVGFRDEEDALKFKFPAKMPLLKRLKDVIESSVDEKYYLSQTAINRLLRKDYTMPQINSQITGTLNTKNNSGQLGFDGGTTLITDDYKNEVIVVNDNGTLKQMDIFNCLDANYHKGMDNHQQRPFILEENHVDEVKIGAIRGLNIVDGKRKDYVGAPTEQRIEINENDTANCLTSVQKDNVVIETNKQTLISLFGTGRNSTAERVYDAEGISTTLKSTGGGGGAKTGLYLHGTRIRRLTPKEVFRLMGYSDEFFDRCKFEAIVNTTIALSKHKNNFDFKKGVKGMSDSQLYKQGGNSIVVDTILALLIQILTTIKISYKYDA